MTHVVNTKLIKSFGNFNLLLGIKKGIGELFTLSQCALNNLKTGDIAQEIGHTGVVAVGIPRGCGVRILTSLDGGEAIVVHCFEKTARSVELKQDRISEYGGKDRTLSVGIGSAIAIGVPIGGAVCARTHFERRYVWTLVLKQGGLAGNGGRNAMRWKIIGRRDDGESTRRSLYLEKKKKKRKKSHRRRGLLRYNDSTGGQSVIGCDWLC